MGTKNPLQGRQDALRRISAPGCGGGSRSSSWSGASRWAGRRPRRRSHSGRRPGGGSGCGYRRRSRHRCWEGGAERRRDAGWSWRGLRSGTQGMGTGERAQGTGLEAIIAEMNAGRTSRTAPMRAASRGRWKTDLPDGAAEAAHLPVVLLAEHAPRLSGHSETVGRFHGTPPPGRFHGGFVRAGRFHGGF